MTQLYDLCLTLAPPPADVPAGAIANAELYCAELGFHQPIALPPLADPFTPAERDELTWYLETYWQWPYEEFARRGLRVEQLLTEAGRRLYQAVFGSAQAMAVVQPWRLLPDAVRQLSIISNVPQALSLPWELLCDEQGFLALRTKNPVSIIRRLPQSELGALPTAFTPPLRVLLVTARPDDAGFVDPRGIARELLEEVQPRIAAGAIALEFLRPPTRAALRQRLSQSPPVHILHFDGHGAFDETPVPGDSQRLHGGAQGKLAFESALKQRPTLVIADNLESILPSGDAPLDAAARAQLWDVMLRLSAAGAGVIVTSRDAQFGDGRMAHGKEVKHLELGGLHPEDAYSLAVQLFKDLDIPQSRAPYPKLRDLLLQLDHQPLAIQLVLPALGETGMTIDRLSTDFAALLPRFSDDRETGRNRSLLASLEYSPRRLSDEERQLLVWLAPFEGGAHEEQLLAITEIAERDWMRLRPALERAALLTPERISGLTAPFLRFHPVLAPYLRTQPCAEDAALRSRYATRYSFQEKEKNHEETKSTKEEQKAQ